MRMTDGLEGGYTRLASGGEYRCWMIRRVDELADYWMEIFIHKHVVVRKCKTLANRFRPGRCLSDYAHIRQAGLVSRFNMHLFISPMYYNQISRECPPRCFSKEIFHHFPSETWESLFPFPTEV